MSSTEIAKTILQQLGGAARIKMMVGVKTFIATDKGVVFQFKAKAENKANVCRIELNGMDLYDVKFERVWGTKHTVISEFDNIYNDMLVELFEKQTKLYLRF